EILEEWDGHVEKLLPMIRGETPFPRQFPFADAIVLTDLAVHAQDVRGALDAPGDRDSAGVRVALASFAAALGLRLALNGVPPLRIRYGEKERVAGQGEPGDVGGGALRDIPRPGRQAKRRSDPRDVLAGRP